MDNIIIRKTPLGTEVVIDGVKINELRSFAVKVELDAPIAIELSGFITNEVRVDF